MVHVVLKGFLMAQRISIQQLIKYCTFSDFDAVRNLNVWKATPFFHLVHLLPLWQFKSSTHNPKLKITIAYLETEELQLFVHL